MSLFKIAQDLNATLYLVNYAAKGTPHADKVRLMKVVSVKEGRSEPVETMNVETTREAFSA
ncbi:hypothetical protein ACFPVS_05760 [Neisseria weixii]|uniref:Uncharacterized protein n=1 Tax=Neisseria weixii TaxID=1853276 RepID=A0A3N4MN64_9NEIS|nr:hypothetical protein [Neisseria weixii]ATD64208.1 hypothetical protein CGZ65_00700 [Neisseria weixii]RPD85081.1 hypothetical protein EGK74_09880 [Neisseria weixii]RPD86040.1 hypothetical protein EGK75_09905 [Neisseria weixii]